MAKNTQETVLHESAGAGEESVLASLGLNPQLFAFQLFNFALVFAIVWFMILKPLTKKMEERKNVIDESLNKAKEVEESFVMSQQKFQEKIDEAKVEANKIIADAHEQSKMMQEKMKSEAKNEIELLVNQAKKNIQNEKVEMMEAVKQEVATLVVAAVSKVMEEKMDSDKDRAYIKKVVDSIS